MKDTLDVITGLNQAVQNAQWKETGALEREKANGPREFKINDGFKCKFNDNQMMLEYTIEVKNALMPRMKLEVNNGIENKMMAILKYLKEEYKKITGNSVTFKEDSKLNIVITPISYVTQVNRYTKVYTIGGVESYKDKYTKEVAKMHKDNIKKIDTLEEQLTKKKL